MTLIRQPAKTGKVIRRIRFQPLERFHEANLLRRAILRELERGFGPQLEHADALHDRRQFLTDAEWIAQRQRPRANLGLRRDREAFHAAELDAFHYEHPTGIGIVV